MILYEKSGFHKKGIFLCLGNHITNSQFVFFDNGNDYFYNIYSLKITSLNLYLSNICDSKLSFFIDHKCYLRA